MISFSTLRPKGGAWLLGVALTLAGCRDDDIKDTETDARTDGGAASAGGEPATKPAGLERIR